MYLSMALRVLLADESSTIKKAIQMVLSDYGVEVKSVPTGIDVLSVTQTFQPDIILADILLNKKNGYEVCAEIKKHNETKDIPVILMWSSFMQLDPNQYAKSEADGSIEKPFEAETIRNLVERLVPKLQTFPLKGFLNHPNLPDFEESDTFVRQRTSFAESAEVSKTPTYQIDGTTTNTDVDDADQFAKVNLNPVKPVPETDEWSAAPTNQFVIETENFGDFEEVKVINSKGDDSTDLQQKLNDQVRTYLQDSPVASHKAQSTLQQKNHSSFDEQLMREEIRHIAERICWQVIPEITEKIVREELAKLMQGIEKNT
ncbi:response regulator [Pseudobdellovibrio exovorus]|uniref:Putative phosphate regulon protein n=1 Tax=Pseudobdellovibrio exovorus JSS TaxID=1184267 RepID=M4V9I0_9BACT|nr:response regulator [Pseudobdellovibrio exovorus]AGH96042.1 putative phosphate regulon protein [Pseudobdellovibrio exovorus JSS]